MICTGSYSGSATRFHWRKKDAFTPSKGCPSVGRGREQFAAFDVGRGFSHSPPPGGAAYEDTAVVDTALFEGAETNFEQLWNQLQKYREAENWQWKRVRLLMRMPMSVGFRLIRRRQVGTIIRNPAPDTSIHVFKITFKHSITRSIDPSSTSPSGNWSLGTTKQFFDVVGCGMQAHLHSAPFQSPSADLPRSLRAF